VIDTRKLEGSVDFVGEGDRRFEAAEGAVLLAARLPRADVKPHPALPDDTRLWAAMQQVGGGTWGGCVYDVESIVGRLKST